MKKRKTAGDFPAVYLDHMCKSDVLQADSYYPTRFLFNFHKQMVRYRSIVRTHMDVVLG